MKHSTLPAADCTTRTIGLDLSDRVGHFTVLEADGRRTDIGKVQVSREALRPFFQRLAPGRLVIEVGSHSAWVSRLAEESGLDVIVANPRKVELIAKNVRKTDREDSLLLARLGRSDPGLLCPVEHRSSGCQTDRAILSARSALVEGRTRLINHVRGILKSFGERLPACSAHSFHNRVLGRIPKELQPALTPIVVTIGQITEQIRNFEDRIEKLAEERYPATAIMREIAGVGAQTSLQFVLTIEDPARLTKSRQVGPYLGLVPRKQSSGNSDPELRITKAGDREMRRLLVIAANYILGPFGPDCDLRRFGMHLAEGGGKNARKRAKVAVARKLAVLMHRLWRTGEAYDPFHLAKRRGEAVLA